MPNVTQLTRGHIAQIAEFAKFRDRPLVDFETISSGFGRLFAILGPLYPKHSGGPVQLGRLTPLHVSHKLTFKSVVVMSAVRNKSDLVRTRMSNGRLQRYPDLRSGQDIGQNYCGLRGLVCPLESSSTCDR